MQDTLEKCGKCGEVIQEHIVRALGRAFHPPCFTCVACARCIGDERFALDSQNQVYCLDDFYRYGGGSLLRAAGELGAAGRSSVAEAWAGLSCCLWACGNLVSSLHPHSARLLLAATTPSARDFSLTVLTTDPWLCARG